MNWPLPLRVFGLGSPHGDDAVAWHVIEALRRLPDLDGRVELRRLDGSQRLLDQLDGQGTLVVIDAMRGGQPLGSVLRLEWPDRRLERLRPATSHDLGLNAALELAQTLGTLPELVVIYGIEAGDCAPGAALSPAEAAAADELARRLAAELHLKSKG